mgnify:CR=1 FL=1
MVFLFTDTDRKTDRQHLLHWQSDLYWNLPDMYRMLVQSLATQNSIRVLMCIVPTIGVILAYIVYKNKYKLSDEFMKKVVAKINGSGEEA